jgi:hypothetical protein
VNTDAIRDDTRGGRDWRVWFGLASTLFWLWLGFLYIAMVVGWQNFLSQPAESLGGFLEGAFAPLAFLWLVIGFFLQQRELRQNNSAIRAQYEQMRRTAESTEIQAIAIRANALHQQQETTLLVADRVHKQLGAVVGLLWMSSQFVEDNPEAPSEERVSDLWSQLGSGDPEGFARQFMALYYRNAENRERVRDLFFGTPIRARHSDTITRSFERLLARIRECDPDGVIEDATLGSAHGTLYRMIEEQREPIPEGGTARA